MYQNTSQLGTGLVATNKVKQPLQLRGATAPPQTTGNNHTTTAIAKPLGGTLAGGNMHTTTTTPQQTAGGLNGNIRPPQYNSSSRPQPPSVSPLGQTRPMQPSSSSFAGNRPAGQNQNAGFDRYDEFRDSALGQAMRTLQPQIDSNNSRFEQMMVGRGIQPGTEQYNRQRELLDRGNNDMLSQAAYGAQQQGLAAQNQAWNQGYQYDALANALNQSQIGANASMYGSRLGADASMYGSDAAARASMYNSDNSAGASRYGADLAHALGINRLNENAYQFDANDIFRNQQHDGQMGLAWANQGLGQQNQDLQNWIAQQNAQQNWFNNLSGTLSNSPAASFTGGDLVGSMQNAGQNQANANAGAAGNIGGMLGGLLGLIPFSDRRLKKNIKYIGKQDGVKVYEFDYKDAVHGIGRYRGVMAQDVIKTHPKAVYNVGEYMKVDYSKLPVNMERVA
jgi:hypothetical protein